MTLSPERAAAAASLFTWGRAVAARAIPPTVPPHVREDLVADGLLGLCQAAEGARGSLDSPMFRAYAAKRIRGAILDAQRQADPLNRAERAAVKRGELASPAHPTSLDLITEPLPARPLAPMTQATRDLSEAAHAAMSTLTERERLAVSLTIEDGYTLTEAGKVLGLSESGVCRARARALARLRRSLIRESV